VRGYLEAEQLGDNAVGGTVELRSPSLPGLFGDKTDEWRVYAFAEGAVLTIRSPLPQEESRFNLASYGVGSRIRLFDHLNGSLDAAVPLVSQPNTMAHSLVLTFRVWADF
jgi:hemolysin activation/secretion protein